MLPGQADRTLTIHMLSGMTSNINRVLPKVGVVTDLSSQALINMSNETPDVQI